MARSPLSAALLLLVGCWCWRGALAQGNGSTGPQHDGAQTISLPPSTAFPVWNITGNWQLQNTHVDDQTGRVPSTGASWAQLLALPWLAASTPTSAVALLNVSISTSCRTLAVLQKAACSSLPWQQLITLEVTPGLLVVPSWQGAQVTARNVTFFCPAAGLQQPNGSADSLDPLHPPTAASSCAVGHVSGWSQLVADSQQLQQWAQDVAIVLDTNVTVPPDSLQGDPPIQVYRSLRYISAQAPGGLLYMNLGFMYGEGLWVISGEQGSISFEGITFPKLPLGPADKFPMSVFPWGMWNVRMERCVDRVPPALVLRNCTLVTNSETMDYASHWAGEYLSVFPDRKHAAAWYGEDPTCLTAPNRSLINQQIELRDQYHWVARNATVLGLQLLNTTLTSQLPPGLSGSSQGLQLTKLFDQEPYVPFPAITWVVTPDAFVAALRDQATQYVAVLANISVDPSLWGPEPIPLRRDLVVAGWPSKHSVVDWQGVAKVVLLEQHVVKMRNLVLMNGGQGGPGARPAWAANLTLYQWPLMFDWAESSLQLQLTTIVVPPSEYAILLAHSKPGAVPNPPEEPPTPSDSSPSVYHPNHLTRLAWAQTASFSDHECHVQMLVEMGIVGTDITVTSKPIAFPLLPRNVTLSSSALASAAPPSPAAAAPGPSSSSNSWRLVLAIVLPLALCATAVMASIAWVLRQREQRRRGGGHDSKGMLGPAMRMLGAAPGQPSANGSPDGSPTGALLATCHSIIIRSEGQAGSGPPSGLHMSHAAASTPRQGQPASGQLPPGHLHSPSHGGRTLSRGRASSVHGGGQASSHHSRSDSQARSMHSASSRSQPLPEGERVDGGAYGVVAMAPMGPGAPLGMQDWALQAARPVNGAAGNGFASCSSVVEDSFDAPADPRRLLIHQLTQSCEQEPVAGNVVLPSTAGDHDVASQLKDLVTRLQEELGDQEVTITRVLGQGGGGVVYQGVWRGLTVAVKSLVFTALPDQPISRHQQRAMTEAAICRTLHHPNIVATYSYDLQALQSVRPKNAKSHDVAHYLHHPTSTHSGPNSVAGNVALGAPPDAQPTSSTLVHEYKLQIIQEFCDGGTLKSLIDEGKLMRPSGLEQPPGDGEAQAEPCMPAVLQLAVDVATGMAHVHSRNIVHGDLTPANVLLRTDNSTVSRFTAKVSDFGLSWKLARGQEHISNARQGTSCYISPEVLHVGIMSRAADVWSFGVILHEMYHGTPSWRQRGYARPMLTDTQVVASAIAWPGLEPLRWSPRCPEPLRALITACLAPDPAVRPSFSSVANKLRAMQAQLLGLAPPADAASNPPSTSQLQLPGSTASPMPSSVLQLTLLEGASASSQRAPGPAACSAMQAASQHGSAATPVAASQGQAGSAPQLLRQQQGALEVVSAAAHALAASMPPQQQQQGLMGQPAACTEAAACGRQSLEKGGAGQAAAASAAGQEQQPTLGSGAHPAQPWSAAHSPAAPHATSVGHPASSNDAAGQPAPPGSPPGLASCFSLVQGSQLEAAPWSPLKPQQPPQRTARRSQDSPASMSPGPETASDLPTPAASEVPLQRHSHPMTARLSCTAAAEPTHASRQQDGGGVQHGTAAAPAAVATHPRSHEGSAASPGSNAHMDQAASTANTSQDAGASTHEGGPGQDGYRAAASPVYATLPKLCSPAKGSAGGRDVPGTALLAMAPGSLPLLEEEAPDAAQWFHAALARQGLDAGAGVPDEAGLVYPTSCPMPSSSVHNGGRPASRASGSPARPASPASPASPGVSVAGELQEEGQVGGAAQ